MLSAIRTSAAILGSTAILSIGTVALAGETTSQTFDIDGFTGVKASAGVQVEFEIAPEFSVEATVPAGQEDRLKVSKKGDRLVVSRKSAKGWSGNSGRYIVVVKAPELDYAAASSGASFKASDLKADDLDVSVASGGSLNIDGTCDSLDSSAASGGSANLKQMECKEVDASAASGGSLRVYASEAIRSRASSGGSVVVYGDPSERDVQKRSMSGGSTSFK